MTYSPTTQRAIKNYGFDACVEAFRMHSVKGYGASGIANEGPLTIKTTRQADAAINAGREIAEKQSLRVRYFTAEAGEYAEAVVPGLDVIDALRRPTDCYSTPARRVKEALVVKYIKTLTSHNVLVFQIL